MNWRATMKEGWAAISAASGCYSAAYRAEGNVAKAGWLRKAADNLWIAAEKLSLAAAELEKESK